MTRKPAAALLVMSLAVLALALIPAAGIAAKGGNGAAGGNGGGKPGGGGGTIVLRMVEDANGNGSPNWADTISFDVATTATDAPELRLQCYQDGVSVYRTQTAYYDGYPFWWTQLMKLDSSVWTSGAADCTAVLFDSSGRKTTTLATLEFHVDA